MNGLSRERSNWLLSGTCVGEREAHVISRICICSGGGLTEARALHRCASIFEIDLRVLYYACEWRDRKRKRKRERERERARERERERESLLSCVCARSRIDDDSRLAKNCFHRSAGAFFLSILSRSLCLCVSLSPSLYIYTRGTAFIRRTRRIH